MNIRGIIDRPEGILHASIGKPSNVVQLHAGCSCGCNQCDEAREGKKSKVEAGGAGSGCHGPNCGRPSTGGGGKSKGGGKPKSSKKLVSKENKALGQKAANRLNSVIKAHLKDVELYDPTHKSYVGHDNKEDRQHNKEMQQMHRGDLRDTMKIYDALQEGRFKRVDRILDRMDSDPRDRVIGKLSNKVLKKINKGYGEYTM